MFHIRAKTTVTDFPSKRAYTKAMREAHQAQGIYYHTELVPGHFKVGASDKYAYARRSSKYLERKRRMWERRSRLPNGQYVEGSGLTDLVLSGDMRDQVTKKSVIRPYPTRVTIAMDGPRYMVMKTFDGDVERAVREGWGYGKGRRKKFSKSRSGVQPDKQKEIQATTRQERDDLAAIADKILQQHLTRTGETKRG